MDRGELSAAIAAVLVLAVLLGWILRWIFTRVDGAGPRSLTKTADMASQLHAAEEARIKAEQRLATIEGDFKARLSDLEAELASTQRRLLTAQEQTEEIRAAYRAAMAGREV